MAGKGPDGEGVVTADYTVLRTVRERFNDLAAAFRNSQAPLGQQHDKTVAGAGQFTPDVQPGAVTFLLSWREVFDVCEDSAGMIAGNVGKTAVDLNAVDVDQSIAITL